MKACAFSISTYLVILDHEPDGVLVPGLQGVEVVAVVCEHDDVHLIFREPLQGAQQTRDVEVRQELVAHCFGGHKISDIANLNDINERD